MTPGPFLKDPGNLTHGRFCSYPSGTCFRVTVGLPSAWQRLRETSRVAVHLGGLIGWGSCAAQATSLKNSVHKAAVKKRVQANFKPAKEKKSKAAGGVLDPWRAPKHKQVGNHSSPLSLVQETTSKPFCWLRNGCRNRPPEPPLRSLCAAPHTNVHNQSAPRTNFKAQ